MTTFKPHSRIDANIERIGIATDCMMLMKTIEQQVRDTVTKTSDPDDWQRTGDLAHVRNLLAEVADFLRN